MVGCNNNAKEKSNDVIETTPEIENQSDKEIAWKESITDESTTEQETTEESTTENSTESIRTEDKTEKAIEKEKEKVTTAPTAAPTQAVTEPSTHRHTEAHTTEAVTTILIGYMLKATMFKSGCMTLYLRKMVRLIRSCPKLICLKVVGRVRRQRITLHIKGKNIIRLEQAEGDFMVHTLLLMKQ